MPKLGMTMKEGKVVAWPVAVGGRVEKGAPVVVIESEKAEVEIEAAATGVLRHVYVEAGETVPCGTLLGAIADTADEALDVAAFRRAHDHPDVDALPLPDVPPPVPPAAVRREGPPVTPAARLFAAERGIDLASVRGTGPGGRVTREDVEAAVGGPVRLDVPETGAGDPVVLLPGLGADVSVFARQIPELARRFRVLGVNPRGVAASEAPPQAAYEVATMAGDVAALLDGPAHVIGASLGAAVAIELALAHPDRVRTLTLVTPFVDAPARLLAVVDSWCDLAKTVPPAAVARAIVPWMFAEPTLGDASALARTLHGFAAMHRQTPPATLARQAAGLRAWSGSRRLLDLGRLGVPVLVVGGADDLLTPAAREVAAAIAGATCTIVPRAGHAVLVEAPDAVNAALALHLG
jgi:pyruvate dehydrogenase E2 component (dihydrolipoamide acetyltransferase)